MPYHIGKTITIVLVKLWLLSLVGTNYQFPVSSELAPCCPGKCYVDQADFEVMAFLLPLFPSFYS